MVQLLLFKFFLYLHVGTVSLVLPVHQLQQRTTKNFKHTASLETLENRQCCYIIDTCGAKSVIQYIKDCARVNRLKLTNKVLHKLTKNKNQNNSFADAL